MNCSFSKRKLKNPIVFAITLVLPHTLRAETKPSYNVNDYYQLVHESRIYVFDDLET